MDKDAVQAREKAVRVALTAMALERGDAAFDADAAFRAGATHYDIAGAPVTVHSAAVDAVGPDNGDLVKIVASLVFLF